MAGTAGCGERSPGSLRRRLRSAEEAQQRQAGLVRQLQDEVRSGQCPAAGRACEAARSARRDSAGARGASPGRRHELRAGGPGSARPAAVSLPSPS